MHWVGKAPGTEEEATTAWSNRSGGRAKSAPFPKRYSLESADSELNCTAIHSRRRNSAYVSGRTSVKRQPRPAVRSVQVMINSGSSSRLRYHWLTRSRLSTLARSMTCPRGWREMPPRSPSGPVFASRRNRGMSGKRLSLKARLLNQTAPHSKTVATTAKPNRGGNGGDEAVPPVSSPENQSRPRRRSGPTAIASSAESGLSRQ